MSWRDRLRVWPLLGRLLFVLGAAGLTAGCFEPLYGSQPALNTESVHDKLGAVDIPLITAPKGTPAARIAVGMRNALQFDLNGGAGPNAPTHRLEVTVSTRQLTVIVDLTSGRPDAQVDSVIANYKLVEIATGKAVVTGNTFAHVDYDIPGSAQRFAAQRAERDAEDKATKVVAEAIRNRLASYFVAGT
jgi:LPS-assembly lipoprotein